MRTELPPGFVKTGNIQADKLATGTIPPDWNLNNVDPSKLPLGVVNAVPASQIAAGTVSIEKALSFPEGSLTQKQKDKLLIGRLD